MLSLKWENNPIQVSEMSTIKVTEKLLNSHLHMVRGAIRATKLPMVVWVYDLDIEAFKESLDVSKEFCNRIDEDGKTLDRGFNFHTYRDQHFALSPSMQAVEINKETIFVGGQGIYWIKISMWGNKKLAI